MPHLLEAGMARRYPLTAVLWLGGILAIVGTPPFGIFSSELMILRGALDSGRWWIAAGYLTALAIAMGAITSKTFRMAFGTPNGAPSSHLPGGGWSNLSPVILLVCACLLGIYLPAPITDLLQAASHTISGN